ncbi:MAG: NAD(P)/FAD-dependent oxidoreductase [Candidatus Omnitrophota bacterium]|nr:NAD(P)/FAD-dependent oxidoreductase [Candidatus Omnitrophota bacterium]
MACSVTMFKRAGAGAVVLGAGPAGLACSYELSRRDVPTTVVERSKGVGGLCRTFNYNGFLFDIGGHRFLSRSREVNAIWEDVLGEDLLRCSRKSSIYYQGHFYRYPLNAFDTLKNLGLIESARCFFSYLNSQVMPPVDQTNFEGWMTRRFGRRLFEIFFKPYTEKVWGISCAELSGDWASQRIQQLSLRKAIKSAIFGNGNGKIKSLSDEFLYPKLGPGQFCDRLKTKSESLGTQYRMQAEVDQINVAGKRVDSVEIRNAAGRSEKLCGDSFISSIPLPVLIERIRPRAPLGVLSAARSLKFRSFISVNLIFNEPRLFDENWIYIQSPDITAGRVQNYKNWSSAMVPDAEKTSLGVEYFVSEGDSVWSLSDEQMMALALEELERIRIVGRAKVAGGFVVRVANAYPVYDSGYQRSLHIIRAYLETIENLQAMGRAGLFRYNNSDHAVLTGLCAARNILGEKHDLWAIDPDQGRDE